MAYCPPKLESRRSGSPRTAHPFNQAQEDDSIQFAGNEQDPSTPEKSWQGRFIESCKTQSQRFRSWAEKQRHWFYKQATKLLMIGALILDGLVKLPPFIRSIIERRFFFSPPTVSSLRLIDQERYPGLRQKIGFEIKFQSGGADSHELAAWYIPAKPGKQTVVFSHGRASNISDLAPVLKALSDQGYGVFAYDYPGFGNSEGQPTEENLYEAGIAACKFLAGDDKNEHRIAAVPYSKQILMGHSLGGAVAVDIAKRFAEDAKKTNPKDRTFNQADNPELRGQPQALVVVNTFNDIKSALTAKGQDFHWALQRMFKAKKLRLNFNSANKLPNVSMPILVLHGDNDKDVSLDLGNELFMSTRDAPKGRLEILPDTKHTLKDDRVCKQVTDAITRFLKPTPPAADSSMV